VSPDTIVQWISPSRAHSVKRADPKLIYFNEVDKGGHFAAWHWPDW
jgi:hypothetical protein